MIKLKLFGGIFAACITLASSTALQADETSHLASLSKKDFLLEYENNFISTLVLTRELANRMGSDFSEDFDVDSPVSKEERMSFACTYDVFSSTGELDLLIAQMPMIGPLREEMANDPSFSYANLIFDEEWQRQITPADSEVLRAAMSECEMIKVATNRMNFSTEFLTKLSEVGQASGLVKND